LSDRFGARPFATGGMIGTAIAFVLLELLPVNFPYWLFAILLFFTGIAMSSFGSPNRAAVMNSLPAQDRGAGSGMNTTFQNSAQVLSIGIFFSLMIVGLSSSLPQSLYQGLVEHGVSSAAATRVSQLPPVSTLFAAFLGYNPIQHLVGPSVLSHLTAAQQATLTGRSFFPTLITAPFRAGLHVTFDFAIGASLVAAAVSWTRGGKVATAAPTVSPVAVRAGDAGRADGTDGADGADGELAGAQDSEAIA
jgi:hypothetical protein